MKTDLFSIFLRKLIRHFFLSVYIKYYLLLVFLFFSGIGSAQKYKYTIYNEKNIASFKVVNQVIQDSLGFVWLATDNGLIRFDGKTFDDYTHNTKSRDIKAFAKYDESTIIFANDVGIYTIQYKNNQAEIAKLVSAENTLKETTLYYPNNLFVDREKSIWISQPNATISKWTQNGLSQFSLQEEDATGSSNSTIYIGQDSFGTIWAASPIGNLYAFDANKNTFVFKKKFEIIQSIFIDETTIWIAGKKLTQWKVDRDKKIKLQKSIDTKDINITHFNKSLNDTYFIGTQNKGLYSFKNNEHNTLQKVFGSNDPHRIEELPFKNIRNLYFTNNQINSEGSIWVSTDSGFGLLESSYFNSIYGLANDNTFSIYPNGYGKTYISFGNVWEVDTDNAAFTQLADVGKILAISETSAGLWLSNSSSEIFKYENGKKTTNIDLSWRGGSVFFMESDNNNNIWFCQAPSENPVTGVAKLTPAGKVITYEEDKGLISRVLVVKNSNRNEIYAGGIGSEGYLYKYIPENDSFENLSIELPFKATTNFEVHDLSIDYRGTVWLATTDGLLYYDTERIHRIDLGRNTTNEIRAVCAMKDGGVWLALDTHGLLYYKNGNYTFFEDESGLPSKIVTYRCLKKDENEKIWVGTNEGTVYSRRKNPKAIKTRMPYLLSTTLNDKKVDNPSSEELGFTTQSQLQLHFVSATFPGEDLVYQHRLVPSGLNLIQQKDILWSKAETQNILNLKCPKNGGYTLEIRAKQVGGYDWSDPLIMKISVSKVWYKTILAFVLLISVLAGILGFLLHKLVGRKIKSLEQKLSEQKEQLSEVSFQKDSLEKETKKPIHKLYALLNQISGAKNWDELFIGFEKTLTLMPYVDAIEFGYIDNHIIHFQGFSRKNRKKIIRTDEFNEKENLVSWSIVHDKPLLINNFDKEHINYIDLKISLDYQSIILAPFQLKNETVMVLTMYGIKKESFTESDLMMLTILSSYISKMINVIPIIQQVPENHD